MTPEYPGLRIVRSWPGQNTGDVCYETEDGRIWRSCTTIVDITGVSYGIVHAVALPQKS